jgi:hypothetical protein
MSWAPEAIHIETWPDIFPLLRPALELTGETPAELIDLLLAHQNQLWILRKGGDPVAAAVSELEPTSRGLLVHVRLMGGSGMADWVEEAVRTITHAAHLEGAVRVRVEVIPALERVLRERGFKRSKVVMERAT